jgi:hypothetical protein
MNTDEPGAADGRNQTIQVPERLAVSSAISAPLREILVCCPLFRPSPHVASKDFGPFISLAEAQRSQRKTHRGLATAGGKPPNRAAFAENGRGERRYCALAVQIGNKAGIRVHLSPSVVQNEFFRILLTRGGILEEYGQHGERA